MCPEYIRCPTSLSRASWIGMKTFGAMRPTKAMESRLAAQGALSGWARTSTCPGSPS